MEAKEDYISWDEFFMGIAVLASLRSKDPVTQVGACIVSDDNRILSIGYNGAPNGFNDEDFPWNKEHEDKNKTKFPYVVHAEANALLNYKGSRSDFVGATLYASLFPCNECAKLIVQSGIKKVIYLDTKKNKKNTNLEAARNIFDVCNIEYKQIDEVKHKTINLSLNPKNTI